MIRRFLICSLLILGSTLVTQAQLQKGSWMVNGALRQNNLSQNFVGPSLNSFGLLLAPELTYMVTSHLMLGGRLRIGLNGNTRQRFAPVSQHLLIRHYFKRLDNIFLFYGGELIFNKITITEVGTGSRNFRSKSAFLQSGVMIFLQEAIALECLFNYRMISFQSDSRLDRTSVDSGTLQLEGRLQFFIHPVDKSNPKQTDYRFYPGDWLVGGSFQLGGDDFIKPEIQRIWGNGWTTGLRLEAALRLSAQRSVLGVTPLIRKYFRPEKKGKLWLQAGAGITGNYFKIRDSRSTKKRWLTGSRSLSVEGAMGWSNQISPNFTLDFFVSRSYQQSYQGNKSVGDLKVFSTGLIISGLLRR